MATEHLTSADIIFEPISFRNLIVKNRIFRSNISGRFDNYDGSGNETRITWELKFARGGVGAIVSSFVPVQLRGRILPNYATIHRDEQIPFWRRLGERVHEYDCRFIMQLSHSGRQRDIGGIESDIALSSTDRPEPLHGFPCRRMTIDDIRETVEAFAQSARRAREAGLDGVELHAANGYLFTQFLSSAINDRDDEYGGPLENRARFLLDVVRAIRTEVGPDFHLQVKISATEYANAVLPWEGRGNTLRDSIQVCKWIEAAGVDAIHVSTGSMFPHPRNPAGDLPVEALATTYDTMVSSGALTFRNLVIFRTWPLSQAFRKWWVRARGPRIEGLTLPDARAIKQAVGIPVICTGGFQTASVIRRAITEGYCDAVSIARPLVANNDLVQQFAAGRDRPLRPCTYCNKCLVNVIEHPLGCYEESRFDSREDMIRQIMSVFEPAEERGGEPNVSTAAPAPATAPRKRRWLTIGLIALAVVALLGLGIVAFFQRDVPEMHADPVENFKYGSIGADAEQGGVPYWIWRVLPRVFPEYLPNRAGEGYARFGFVYEAPDRVRPIGTSVREKPIALVGLNCAVCHTGVVRDAPEGPARIVLGMPAHQYDIESYFRFLFACAADERFNPDSLLAAINAENPGFSPLESLIYRYIAIPRTKQALIDRAAEVAVLGTRPPFGPGRVDTFNPYKIHFGFDLQADDTVGTADLPSLWNQRPRQGLWLHWDGNNDRVEERNISAALGAGATEESLDHEGLGRVADWIWDLPPPQLPRERIDAAKAAAGRGTYQARCANCHELGAPQVGQVVRLEEIGTDPERFRSFTPALAEKMNTFGTGRPWRFSHFRKSEGYANMPLDGLWLRAPYLHNGSVPTLRDLLEPPDRRPAVFYRGYPVYDYASVGFVSSGPEAERAGFRFDTSVRGNSNAGHVYGTNLSPAEREALLEFLKTL